MQGYFPMAESSDGEIFWHSPDPRAIIPFREIKMPRSLRQILKKQPFEYRINSAFEEVIRACSLRDDTWISEEIIENYVELHKLGLAYSVESWQNDTLVGGLYGVVLGGAFFGESMFSLVSNSSKAAFYFLVERMKECGFILLDTQYLNSHTESLGAIEIPKRLYLKILDQAITATDVVLY